jgi:hypothetical protein
MVVGPGLQNTEFEGYWPEPPALTVKFNKQVCPPTPRVKLAVPLFAGVPLIVYVKLQKQLLGRYEHLHCLLNKVR